ncbi:MAG: glycosyltransferase family 4 protein [Spirochaetes bacterium]|nr:glycosyltransferase family 4 protein [Spirochaetota bacterium]
MVFWLIQIGEVLPIEGTDVRLFRTGLLAKYLVENGHKVVWWTSTYSHVSKKHLFSKTTSIEINQNYTIKLIKSVAYKSNVSLRRIINHWGIARKFKRLSKLEEKPDIIISSFPLIEISLIAARLGKKRNIPVVLDVRDLWPDIFIDLFPDNLKRIAKLFFFILFYKTQKAFSNASAIMGITSEFVNWGLDYAKRSKSDFDLDFPMGYYINKPDKFLYKNAENFWDKQIGNFSDYFIICFFGYIGRQFDFQTVIKAAEIIAEQKRNVLFIICGDGDNLDYYKNMAANIANIIFPGWIDKSKIWSLMERSSVGLAPYVNRKDFRMSTPNKIVEYLSASLPIVSCINGIVDVLLNKNKCGLTYKSGDPNSLVNKIIYLLENPDILSEESVNAYKLFSSKFNIENINSDMLSYFNRIISRNN